MPPEVTSDLPLTERQVEVIRALYDFIRQNGRYPTFREACDHSDIDVSSPNSMQGFLAALARKGIVAFEHNRTFKHTNWRFVGLRLTPSFTDDMAGERLQGIIEGDY